MQKNYETRGKSRQQKKKETTHMQMEQKKLVFAEREKSDEWSANKMNEKEVHSKFYLWRSLIDICVYTKRSLKSRLNVIKSPYKQSSRRKNLNCNCSRRWITATTFRFVLFSFSLHLPSKRELSSQLFES